MRAAAFALLIVVSATALAAAQEDDAPAYEGFAPDWAERPTGDLFAQNYPQGAIQVGMSGYAALCCIPNDDGRLICGVAAEEPVDRGFGQAAINVAQGFRMTEESLARFRSDPANWLQVPISFRIQGRHRNEDNVERARRENRNVCRGVALTAP